MKDYNEMAQSVFRRREQYYAKKSVSGAQSRRGSPVVVSRRSVSPPGTAICSFLPLSSTKDSPPPKRRKCKQRRPEAPFPAGFRAAMT